MKQILTASINLDLISEGDIFQGKKGKYLNIKLILKDEVGQYGDIGFITQVPQVLKDDDGNYINGPILGNIKPLPKKQEQTPADAQLDANDTGLPF